MYSALDVAATSLTHSQSTESLIELHNLKKELAMANKTTSELSLPS